MTLLTWSPRNAKKRQETPRQAPHKELKNETNVACPTVLNRARGNTRPWESIQPAHNIYAMIQIQLLAAPFLAALLFAAAPPAAAAATAGPCPLTGRRALLSSTP